MDTEVTPMMAAFSAVAMLVLTAGVVCWSLTALRLAAGYRLVPQALIPVAFDLLKFFGAPPAPPLIDWRPRRPVPWGVVDLVAVPLLFIFLTAGVGLALRQWTGLSVGTEMEDLTLGQRKLLTIANITVSLLILFLCVPLMALRPGTSIRDFGWHFGALVRDVRLGLIGFVMLAPPVYALQGVLVYYWKPSEHPLMEMFKTTPDAAFFATLIAAAVIVAPLVEEILFRVFLQGWLEKLVSFRGSMLELLFGRFAMFRTRDPLGAAEQPIMAQLAAAAPDPNFSVPTIVDQSFAAPPVLATDINDDQPELRGLRAWAPIAISSIIFALLHWDHGPDWVPLTLLAAGMGYLYQRTHSVIPSLVVHVCLNGLSMCGLWIQVYELKGLGPGG